MMCDLEEEDSGAVSDEPVLRRSRAYNECNQDDDACLKSLIQHLQKEQTLDFTYNIDVRLQDSHLMVGKCQ